MAIDYDGYLMSGPGGPEADDPNECPDCDGSGERRYFPFDEPTKCEPCNGTGRLPKPERDYDPDPDPVIDMRNFP